MCTGFTSSAAIEGVGKRNVEWFPVTKATIGFDHSSHSKNEHSLLIDFTNYDLGTDSRIALEMDLASGKAVLALLQNMIETAEASGVRE